MNRLSVVSESQFDAERLRRQLAGILDVRSVGVSEFADLAPDRFNLVAVNLYDSVRLLALKEWMKAKPKDGKVVFVTHANSHAEQTQALALGASGVIERPIDPKALLKMLWSDVASLAGDTPELRDPQYRSVAVAQDSLQNIFSSACLGEPLNETLINTACAAVVTEIESKGFLSWIDTVRKHHSQTYQHCLLVTGTAVAFGKHIGLSQTDRNRLSFAGMLHDIGKARIPVAVLEKPGPLDADELKVMRTHPELGLEALKASRDLKSEMMDVVVHHHELLDGSGYPHGLKGREISDLVRIMTISDIFGALIERRSYKPPMPREKAYGILVDMGPKLDPDLVREFRFVMQAA